ncbi:TonB-dependent receptor [Stakelama saccharophila]|uniref:Carboxypeptidase regulatory-like domain-containing protein n=1 Tax=Stakelama saccharophila TaxID=3075605 RepID=A0ABZ0B826_9SPHN|nr:carboxypeptidase regulatory-like domain-containing protein [Stakelama sp. W311]WNO53418.1 carboxypeptidase regulatory-like domain-containing protein [Stakelama sp. W311]
MFRFSRLSSRASLRALLMLSSAIPAAVIAVPAASAQDYTNIAASGRVVAEDGTPVAGATVRITSSDRGVSRTVSTDDTGAYTIPQLAPGNYDFVVSAPGFGTYSEAEIPLTRQTGGANSFRLVPADTGNEIVVTGSRQRIADFQDTTIGSTIDVGTLKDRVPIGRTLRDVMLLTPGTVQGSSSNGGFADQVSIAGASFTENAFYINGLNVTDFVSGGQPTEVPFDFYQSIEVKTGGAPAEFGRATGGYVVATTKSGSNEYHASVTGIWEPGGLRDDAPSTRTTDYAHATTSRKELVLQASGPVIKDHLFVYGLYNLRDIRSMTPQANQDNATTVRNDSPFWGAKVDGYITGDHHLEFTYFDTSNETRNRSHDWDRTGYTLGDETGGTNARAGGVNYVGRYTGTFAPWLTVSGAYGVSKLRSGNLPLDTVNPQVIDYRTDPAGVQIGLNKVTDAFSKTDNKREFYRIDTDLQFHLLGAHHVRIGYDHETDQQTQTFETIGEGAFKIYTVTDESAERIGLPVGSEYYTTRVYAQNGVAHVRNEAFYIQDQWSLLDNRLRLDLGLRNDRFSNQGVNGESFFKSGDLWAPRLGAAFDPVGDGRTRIFGSYGKYFLPMAGDINLNVAGSLVTYTRYNLFNGVSGEGNIPVAGDPILSVVNTKACPDTGIANCEVSADGSPFNPAGAIDAGIKPQSADEFIIGVERQLADHVRVGASFTHRRLGNVIEDISIDAGARAYCTAQGFTEEACQNAYPGGSQFVIANPGRDVTVQINPLPDGTTPIATLKASDLGYPDPKRNYDALTLTFDQEWSLSASYTLAFNKGNYEGGVRSENGQLSINRSADFDSPGFVNGAYGYLPNDRRHTFRAYGSYRLFDVLDLGLNALVQSPAHYSCIGAVPVDVDAYANTYHGYGFYCQGKVVPRGTAFDGDWRTEFNLSAVGRLPLENVDASIRLDVFNIFNSQAVTNYNNYGEISDGSVNPDYRSPNAYQTPRYVRVTAKLGF